MRRGHNGFDYTTANDQPEDPINDRTDYPAPKSRTCPPGQCIPSRRTMTGGEVVGSAISLADMMMGMFNTNALGYHDPDEALDQSNANADRARAGKAAHDEQQALIAASKAREDERAALMGQLSDAERGIYLTHLEANALQPGSDTLTPMGLGRANGQVVRREAVPARRLR